MPYPFTIVLTQLRAKCLTCGHEFKTFVLPDFSYGEKLLFSSNDFPAAILHCIDNPVFDEVDALVEGTIAGRVDKFKIAELLDNVLGICCDPLDGNNLETVHRPVCSVCNGSKVDEFDCKPCVMTQCGLPVATFSRWLSQDAASRRTAVAEKLRDLGFEP
jgi:hypothetical protein